MAKITRYWKNRKKKDYRYKVDEQEINAVRAPAGFKLAKDGSAYERVVVPKKLTEKQLQGQAFAQLRKLEAKRAKAERTLQGSKNEKAIKKWQNKVRKIEEKESQYLERMVEAEKYQAGFVERRELIRTFILVYVTGKYTSGVTVKFTVPVQIRYVQGDEQVVPSLIQKDVFSSIQTNEGLADLESIEIDRIEGLA